MMADASKNHSLFPLETCPQIPDEAFRQFHTIDRELYAFLTRNLRRDPAETVQVMAFLMWLEKEFRVNLIKQMTSLPPILINQIANEATVCMKCVETDMFLFSDDGNEIKILSEYVNFPAGIGLRFFHDNRIAVLRGVGKTINTVCWRAFGDLFSGGEAENRNGGGGGGGGEAAAPLHAMQFAYNPYLNVLPVVPLPAAMAGGLLRVSPPLHAPLRPPAVEDAIGLPLHMLAAVGGFPVYDLATQRQMLPGDLGDLVRKNLSSSNNEGESSKEKETAVAADDRTIFLTFSKGYPITEEEVRDYFTRRLGDFIENLIMQEVEEGEQPLYAKMVARSSSTAVIDSIVEGNKAKYSINGKHVWARKYVKKPPQQRSPPRGETNTSSPANKA